MQGGQKMFEEIVYRMTNVSLNTTISQVLRNYREATVNNSHLSTSPMVECTKYYGANNFLIYYFVIF